MDASVVALLSDLSGMALVATGVALWFLAYWVGRAEWRESGSWWPWRARPVTLGWLVAALFAAIGLRYAYLGVRLWIGDQVTDPIPILLAIVVGTLAVLLLIAWRREEEGTDDE